MKLTWQERLWKYIKIDYMDNCWEWIKSCDTSGYGQMGINCKLYLSHRLSWEDCYGTIPDGLFVLHKCDNRKCCRPDHLFLGNARDNNKDMIDKNRQRFTVNPPYGERQHQAKLTKDQILEIRNSNLSDRELEAIYPVKRRHINDIRNRKKWAWV